jgi:Tfp pilus assembly protein PilE
MAGSKLKHQVRASTLMEVVVAMVIIIVVFGIAMMIYTNVLHLSLSAKKLRAQAILVQEMVKIEQNPESITQTFNDEDFRIELSSGSYQNDRDLLIVSLSAFDQNQQKIAELKKVILSNAP